MIGRLNSLFCAVAAYAVITGSVGAADDVGPPPEVDRPLRRSAFVLPADLERMSNSVLEPMLEHVFREEGVEDSVWRTITEELPIDPGRDIRSITVSSSGPLESDYLIICRATERLDRLPSLMAEHVPGYRRIEIDGYPMHSWSEIVEEKRRHIYAYIHPIDDAERMWIIALNWEHVLDAIAWVERGFAQTPGAAPGGDERPKNAPAMMDDSALFAFVPRSSFPGKTNAIGRGMEHVEWLLLDLGATREACTLLVTVGMETEQTATEIVQVAQGMLALGRMTLREKKSMESVMRLLNLTRIASDGPIVRLELTADAALLSKVYEVGTPHLAASRDESGGFSFEFGARSSASDDDPDDTGRHNRDERHD